MPASAPDQTLLDIRVHKTINAPNTTRILKPSNEVARNFLAWQK
jgi:hypothetical protein